MAGRNVFTILEETAAQYGNAAALHQPVGSKEQRSYRSYTWNEWAQISREIAVGLRELGLQKGEIACILSETRAEFYLADLGIMGAGGVSGALYTAYPIPDLARNVISTAPRFLFVEDPQTLNSLAAAIDEQGGTLPEHIVLLTGQTEITHSLLELQELGRQALARDPQLWARIQDEISPQDPAILYLTSGSTGEPKAGLTSHAAIIANLDMVPTHFPIGPADSTLVFLPSAHIAQRIVLELIPMRMGASVWFSESLARLPSDLRTVKPTVFLAPPRVWERMYATVQSEVKKKPAVARKMFHAALKLGMKAQEYKRAGKSLPPGMAQAVRIADKVVFAKIRERLGGRIRIAASGAAPLGKDLGEFYAAIGMPLVEGYGITEAGVISFNPLDRPIPGSIGKALSGVEMRLAEDNELLVRTPCLFSGYWRDEAATRSVISEDGWFCTGDIAEVDQDGYWYITGRKKELIVSSNGKKIYPARIETFFKTEPIVNQIVLVGDKQPYMTALLTVNVTQAQGLAGMEKFKGQTPSEIVRAEPVTAAVKDAVTRVNQRLADFERIRRFRILDREFTIEHGELTPTMKVRRGRVLENHRTLVNQLYLGKEESN